MPADPPSPSDPRLRIRIVFGEHEMMGPGKADLLDAIARSGSIAAAGRDMGMSYKRAWDPRGRAAGHRGNSWSRRCPVLRRCPQGRYGGRRCNRSAFGTACKHASRKTDNVRAALALVAVGAAPVGIVYATDARAEPRVHVMAHIAPDTHPPITYPLVDLARRTTPAENAFHDFLTGPMAAAIFEEHGFDVLPQDAP
jgi:ABC-type molybdate transport system substrate-binding protein